jgi:esterase
MLLNYQEAGSGQAVIILHGLFGSSTNFKGIARNLEDRCRVITVDLRNHGSSPWDDDVSYPAMARDIAELMDHLSLDNAILVGHSMGGKVAMTLALSQPDRVAKLVVIDIAPVAYGHSHEGLIDAMLDVDPGELRNRRDLDDQLKVHIPEVGVRQFLGQNLIHADGTYEWRVNLRALSDGMDLITGFEELENSYDGECVFVHGEASNYVIPEYHADIHKYFPDARLIGIADTGHWVHAEHPERIIEVVGEMLDSCTHTIR